MLNLFFTFCPLNTALVTKETELEEMSRERSAESTKTNADAERVLSSKIVGLESQLEIWRGEVMAKDIELNQLQEKYTQSLHDQNVAQQQINNLTDTITQLNTKQTCRNMMDVAVQIGMYTFYLMYLISPKWR